MGAGSFDRQWNSTLPRRKKLMRNVGREFKPRKPIRKVSKAKARQLVEYKTVAHAFLAEFPMCAICAVRGLSPAPAVEVHHMFGRIGALLCDRRGFVSSCRGCRLWPHENPREARALGVLGEARFWNVPIDRHSAL